MSTSIDFAIVGFPKCGTTSMIKNLSKCPSLFILPREPKISQILEATLPKNKTIGFKFPASIFNLTPWTTALDLQKIIICWRDPIEHLFTFYQYRQMEIEQNVPWIQKHRAMNPGAKYNFTFDDILKGEDMFDCSLEKSRMDVYTLQALRTFPPDRVLILHFNELKTNPRLFYTKICYFVGISPSELPSQFTVENINSQKVPIEITPEQQDYLNSYYSDTRRNMIYYTKMSQRQLLLRIKKKNA